MLGEDLRLSIALAAQPRIMRGQAKVYRHSNGGVKSFGAPSSGWLDNRLAASYS
jgi:hypothetical protein